MYILQQISQSQVHGSFSRVGWPEHLRQDTRDDRPAGDLGTQHLVNPLPRPIIAQHANICCHTLPGRIRIGYHAPVAACDSHGQHRVRNLSNAGIEAAQPKERQVRPFHVLTGTIPSRERQRSQLEISHQCRRPGIKGAPDVDHPGSLMKEAWLMPASYPVHGNERRAVQPCLRSSLHPLTLSSPVFPWHVFIMSLP